MKKIFMVVNEDRFFLSHRKDIAIEAQRQGWDVTIVCKDTGQRQDVEALGLKMLELPINPTGKNISQELKTFFFLCRLYASNKDAIVHHVGLKTILWGSLAAKLIGVKGMVNAVSGLGVLFSGEKSSLVTKGVMALLRFSHQRPATKVIFQNHEDFSAERVYAFATALMRSSDNAECIKFGLTLFEMINVDDGTAYDVIRTLALCDEFTMFCAFSMRQWPDAKAEGWDVVDLTGYPVQNATAVIGVMNVFFAVILAVQAALCLVFYFITHYFLTKKLNLE